MEFRFNPESDLVFSFCTACRSLEPLNYPGVAKLLDFLCHPESNRITANRRRSVRVPATAGCGHSRCLLDSPTMRFKAKFMMVFKSRQAVLTPRLKEGLRPKAQLGVRFSSHLASKSLLQPSSSSEPVKIRVLKANARFWPAGFRWVLVCLP